MFCCVRSAACTPEQDKNLCGQQDSPSNRFVRYVTLRYVAFVCFCFFCRKDDAMTVIRDLEARNMTVMDLSSNELAKVSNAFRVLVVAWYTCTLVLRYSTRF